MKISRESLKSLQGSGGPTCPDDPAFGNVLSSRLAKWNLYD